ncbi:flavodoxin domain-containing protein [Candidatus Sulfurimonas marisnigri]|uniref:Flavodoxin n=1 Tax=Candidatus Sulfurimonas marisnigri TaxID=2740405 RepID=A0A7S7LYK7_9BACT|nr:flavodoxin domain-containing protein [Candidatus Sulfurimonas marisnigri]QOY53821.1 flavodoxin domain-containing protein [Candidatus Sulfurimonas marisnigri]
MSKIGIFVGTAGGTSMKVANALIEAFEIEEDDVINMEEDFDDVEEQLLAYDVLFLGSSTWGQGDLHFSWVDPILEIEDESIDFSSKRVAFFGAGDCIKHGEHFCSAIGKLHKTFTGAGAKAIGFMPKDSYNYEFSLAEMDDKLCGLAIDEHNESEKTTQRIEQWVGILKSELGD